MTVDLKDSKTLTIFIEWNNLTTIIISYITSVHCTATTNIRLNAGCIGLWCTNNDPARKKNRLWFKINFLSNFNVPNDYETYNWNSVSTKVNKEDNRLFFHCRIIYYYRITQSRQCLLKNHMPNMVLWNNKKKLFFVQFLVNYFYLWCIHKIKVNIVLSKVKSMGLDWNIFLLNTLFKH